MVSGTRSIYFAGDTGFFSGISDVWPERLDLAMLPIAGIGPLMPEFKHMSPRHAVKAMDLLRPRIVVPIHWGTYHLPGTALFRCGPTSIAGRPTCSWRRPRCSSPTCTR